MRRYLAVIALAACSHADPDIDACKRVSEQVAPIIKIVAPTIASVIEPVVSGEVAPAAIALKGCTAYDAELRQLRAIDFDTLARGRRPPTVADYAADLLDYRLTTCRPAWDPTGLCANWCASVCRDLVEDLRRMHGLCSQFDIEIQLGELRQK